jgi:hypothetical protein
VRGAALNLQQSVRFSEEQSTIPADSLLKNDFWKLYREMGSQ